MDSEYILVFALSVVLFETVDPLTCYSCATSNLRNNWLLTGFDDRAKMPDESYSDLCSTDLSKVSIYVCSTNCLAYGIQDYSATGDIVDYLVRGCQEKLTGLRTGPIADRCESGLIYNFDTSQNDKARLQTFAQICNSSICNIKSDFPARDPNCNRNLYGPAPASNSGGTFTCALCGPASDDCQNQKQIRSCTDATWCRTTVIVENGVQLYHSHDCSPVNPLGEPACLVVSENWSQSSGNSSFQHGSCYCQGDNCNAAEIQLGNDTGDANNKSTNNNFLIGFIVTMTLFCVETLTIAIWLIRRWAPKIRSTLNFSRESSNVQLSERIYARPQRPNRKRWWNLIARDTQSDQP